MSNGHLTNFSRFFKNFKAFGRYIFPGTQVEILSESCEDSIDSMLIFDIIKVQFELETPLQSKLS